MGARGIIAFGLVCVAIAATAFAADTAPFSVDEGGDLLTLDRAIDIALEKNLQIAAAELGEDAAWWAKYRAIGGWLPTLDFNTTFTYIDDDSVDSLNAPAEMLRDYFGIEDAYGDEYRNESYSSNLRVTQPIFNGGAEIGAIQAGRAGHAEKREALRATVLETVLNVRTAYTSAVEARQIWRTAQEAMALADETLRLMRARREMGEIADADVLRWEAEAAKAEGAQLEAQNAYELATIALLNLLGVDLTERYELPGLRDDLDAAWYRERMNVLGVAAEETAETRGAVAEHPAVLRMMALQDGAKAQEILAWSEVLPQLNFGYQYNWETDYDIWLDGTESWAATVQFRMPLFDSLRGAFGIVQAQRLRRQALIAREDVERGMVQRAMSARRSLNNAFLRIRAGDKSRAFASENLRNVQSRQQVGEASNLEVLDAQLAFVQARTDYVRAVADFLRAEAEWRYLHADEPPSD